jgi:tetratricopeptide (TPR) repeat protein
MTAEYRLTHSFWVDARGRALPTHGMDAAARYYRTGQQGEAERCCREVIAEAPRHFDALHLLGVLELDRKKYAEAIEWLTRAAELLPDNARVHYHIGNAFLELKRYEEAEAVFRRAVALDANDSSAHNNLGNALAGQQRHEEAVECFRQTLTLAPSHARAQYNLGRSLAALDRLEEAMQSFEAALANRETKAAPDRLADVYGSISELLVGQGRYDEAFAVCQTMAAFRPTAAEWNESLYLLLLGRYAEGWHKYEARWGVADHDAPRADAQVPDLASVAGKRVFLFSEQGRGDIIQFARYAPMLAARGARVMLQVYPEIVPLLATLDGVEAVIGSDEPEPAYDIATPLLSLPLAFGTELATIPGDVPYLRVLPERVAAWRKRLGRRRGRRIGLAWSGALEHQGDRHRSIALERLAPLLAVAGCEFHSVQKDVRTRDREWLGRVHDHGEDTRDLADTAALISLMDLVISVDTAPAHVAGALAKPVWVMLPFSADWRWLLERDDSPWYPTARLFRQKRRGDWDGVVAEVARAISALPARARR